jgi:hypothetical protein
LALLSTKPALPLPGVRLTIQGIAVRTAETRNTGFGQLTIRGIGVCGSSGPATSGVHVDCPSQQSRRRSRRCSTHRSTTASSDIVRMACLAPGSSMALAIADGPSARTPET